MSITTPVTVDTGTTMAPRQRHVSIHHASLKPGKFQRLALALSEALAAWAVASTQKKSSPLASAESRHRSQVRLQEADLRRDAAVAERLQMPRQF
ncbi:hypothetical protein [Nesterenkonia haasae]|uniref:hypothetical protein n=1 Tax=Nesterenkonia haasae TaxID=2587813 RepID=UPI001390A83E|nr:hypothetical protein [Nesterenkonia haasae]NDK30264.1 hypothetical protein [Nesterenkonia haasae]